MSFGMPVSPTGYDEGPAEDDFAEGAVDWRQVTVHASRTQSMCLHACSHRGPNCTEQQRDCVTQLLISSRPCTSSSGYHAGG